MPIIVIAGVAVCVALLARWRAEYVMHRRRVDALRWRVHVNGIRGKSTVTRIIAGMMREAGMTAIAKSTGTFAAVINADGVDEPINRKGPATILEQIEVVRQYVTTDVDALVIECMALKPEYQEVSERMIVRSNIGVLTNVREDHQDVMGETLPEIARSLLSTCPRDGILITSEQNPVIIEVMEEVCAERGSRLVVADPGIVTDDDIARFDYIAFKENVCIALAIAEIVGIDRAVAMDGMVKADPDPGVLRMKELSIGGKHVTWANLFAVNDRESMVAAMEKLVPYTTPATTTVGILNNRADRERRAIQFADVAVHDLSFHRLVTFGAYEGLVTDRLKVNGYPPEHILNLGDEHHPTQDEIIRRMIVEQPTEHVLVVGFVNIHTHQAEEMLEYFEHVAQPWTGAPAGADTSAAPPDGPSNAPPGSASGTEGAGAVATLPRRPAPADVATTPTGELPRRSDHPAADPTADPLAGPTGELPRRSDHPATDPTADPLATPTGELPRRSDRPAADPTADPLAGPTAALPRRSSGGPPGETVTTTPADGRGDDAPASSRRGD